MITFVTNVNKEMWQKLDGVAS